MKFAAVGSNCIDFYENLDGGTPFPGGGPVNMAVYAAEMGAQSAYVGPVGQDAFGQLLRRAVAEKGVDVSRLAERPGSTAVTQVRLEDGDRVLGEYAEGVLADYRLSQEDLDFLRGYDVVVCDLWGKVGGQFRELQAMGVPPPLTGRTAPRTPPARRRCPLRTICSFPRRKILRPCAGRCAAMPSGDRRWWWPRWESWAACAGTDRRSTLSASSRATVW